MSHFRRSEGEQNVRLPKPRIWKVRDYQAAVKVYVGWDLGHDQDKVFSVSMPPGEGNLGTCSGLGKVQTCIARTAKQDAFILLCRLVQGALLLSPSPNICFLHSVDIGQRFVASIYFCYRSTTWKSNDTPTVGEAASRIHSLPPTILPEMRNVHPTLRALQAPGKALVLHKITFMPSSHT